MDPVYPLLPTISIVLSFLVLLPLPSLIAHWNTGAWMYALWTSISCLILGINEIVWKDNVRIVAPVWCDIAVRFFVGMNIGIPASSLAITRRIYYMFSLQSPLASTRTEKRNAVLFDLGLTLGLPIVNMALYYIVQGHRFNIIEQFGCASSLVNTWVTFLLISAWPLALGLISCVYCGLIVRLYLKRRRNLSKTGCTPDFSRYYRVLALGSTDAIFTVPCSIFLIVQNSGRGAVVPYTSWADIHYNFSRIDQIPAVVWKGVYNHMSRVGIYWNGWASPICAFVFFCFFGLTRDMRETYVRVLVGVLRKLGFARWIDKKKGTEEKSRTRSGASQFKAAPNHKTTELRLEATSASFSSMVPSTMMIDIVDSRAESTNSDPDSEMKYKTPQRDSLIIIERRGSIEEQV